MPARAVSHLNRSRSTIATLATIAAAAALFLLGAPQALNAQGRLIGRPCVNPTPPRCAPDADCVVPANTLPCAPTLVRVSSDVKIALADRVLRYEVTEVFKNTSGRVAEADYVFPLPAGAAFEDLKLMINGELVSGETMTADRARGIYEEIVKCGNRVRKGDLVGRLHDFLRVDEPACPVLAPIDGIIVGQAWAARVRQGQFIMCVGVEQPW